MKVTVIPIITGALRKILKNLEKRMEEAENLSKKSDCLDYSTVEMKNIWLLLFPNPQLILGQTGLFGLSKVTGLREEKNSEFKTGNVRQVTTPYKNLLAIENTASSYGYNCDSMLLKHIM